MTSDKLEAWVDPKPSESDYSQFDIIKATQYGAIDRCKALIDAGDPNII